FHSARVQAQQRGAHDAADHDEESHRSILQKDLAENENGERRSADSQGRGISVRKMREEMSATVPETSFSTFEAEQLWQLSAGEIERDAGLEANQNSLRNEIDDGPGPDQPGDEGDRGDHQRRAGRQRAEAGRIACGNRSDRRADE